MPELILSISSCNEPVNLRSFGRLHTCEYVAGGTGWYSELYIDSTRYDVVRQQAESLGYTFKPKHIHEIESGILTDLTC